MAEESESPERPVPLDESAGESPAHPGAVRDLDGPDGGSSIEIGSEDEDLDLLPFPIVAIGASAGGLEACRDLFKTLPPNTGLAFVLIFHLAPDQKSHLVEILGNLTRMRVSPVENQLRPEPNHLYILPPNQFVSVSKGRFRLEPRPEGVRVPMPIDHLFRTLAVDQKNRAIGVILSGADSDGALGLKAIKGEGGIAIVQAPESARHSVMPSSSIAADHVDLVLPPAEIGYELARLGRQFQRPEVRRLEVVGPQPATEEQQLARILLLLGTVAGLDFREYKPATLQRRIARRMMLNRTGTLQDYLRHLQANEAELRDLHEDILINVTHFFRDPDVWEALKTDILPAMFDHRPADRQVRVWVPGCSSGEETYSLAMCLLEFLSGNGEPGIQIFGTDVSERLVQIARQGIYPESIAQDVAPERLHRFFVKTDKHYQVSKRVRDLCIFARQNLCNDPPFSRLDMVSCRNLLIYYSQGLQRQVVPAFHYALRPRGILLLGKSESLRDDALFTLLDRRHKFYMKVASANVVDFEFPRRLLVPAAADAAVEKPDDDTWSDTDLQQAADRLVLARYGPAGVVINDGMEILQTRGHTGLYLEMSPGASSLNLMRMVREKLAAPVLEAVLRAIKQDMPVQVRDLEVRDAEETHGLTLEVLPIQGSPFRGRCYLVLFIPVDRTQENGQAGAEATAGLPPDEKDNLIAQLRKDLDSTRLYLQSLVAERDVKTQDLVSANEEIQSANEELQSANEELETTKEEVQSANEELQTVNEELQQRNIKLTETSNDLNNLLTSVNIPLLILSSGMEIRRFTPPMQRLFNLRQTDVGRPIGEIRHNLTLDDLRPVVQEVVDTLGTRELEVQDLEGRWYLMRVRPYRTSDNKIEGVVIVLVDIDQLRRIQEELRGARDYANAVIESMHLPVVVLTPELTIRTANSAFRALSGIAAQDLEHRSFPDLANALWGLDGLHGRLESLQNASESARFEIEHATNGPEPRVFGIRGRNLRYDSSNVIVLAVEDLTARRKVERALAGEKERLEEQMRSTTQALRRTQDELRALAAGLFRAQEDESRWVARELHDDISQKLAYLDMEMQEFGEQLKTSPDGAEARVEALRQRTSALSEEVRRISHRLHPSILDDLGLTHALRALVDDFAEREDMLATFVSRNLPEEVPREIGGVLYRIAQEALRNVAKHAGKTHVKVTLEGVDGRLRLEIADLGEGFDPEDTRGGLGLIGMVERARLIGGTFGLQSALGRGTTVTVEAPFPAP